MRQRLFASAVCAAFGIATLAAQTQKPPSTDPANNPDAGTTQFPLAAPAGKDSNSRTVAPPGAVNQGPFDPATWKYGPAFNPPPGATLWNPVKLKLMIPSPRRSRRGTGPTSRRSGTAALAAAKRSTR